MLQKGDFLINIVGASIGRAAMFDLECKANINQAVALVRIDEKAINRRYLLHYLNSSKAKHLYNFMKSDVARANLSLKDISVLQIISPPLILQREFAAFVEKVGKLREAARQTVKAMDTLYRAKLQEFFG